VHYKVATLTHNILHTGIIGGMSVYMFNILSVYTPVPCLRSSTLNLLSKPLYKLKDSHPAFSFASPSVWNDLSEFVTSSDSIGRPILKLRLTTELFSLYD